MHNLHPQQTIHTITPRKHSMGYIVWFTGLSGAGKTTMVRALGDQIDAHRRVEILDGDDLRGTLCSDLGFSKADRDSNVARIGYVARLLARHGVAVLVAAISPYRDARREVRAAACSEGIPFLEVFVDAPLETVIARDTKGLYKRALAGDVTEFTGVTAPYEPPEAADVRIRTDRQTVGASVRELLDVLREYQLD
jgi:adenylyl-sulfate kinase